MRHQARHAPAPDPERHLARKFLYIVAGVIIFVLALAFAYRIWGEQLIAATMVPDAPFTAPAPLDGTAYDRPNMWYARPERTAITPAGKRAAVFFVHPTSYEAPANQARWNMPIEDREARDRASGFVRSQASAFHDTGVIWAPAYRQAHFGAFLTGKAEAAKAQDAAYADVALAFRTFLRANPEGPILLVGHGQGSQHLMRLMREQVAGKPLAARIVAAYLPGWPVSVAADLPKLGLPPCATRGQSGCVMSWQSFAEPADPPKGDALLCVNPVTGTPAPSVAARNLGTLTDRGDGATPALVRGAVPAKCDARGYLLIGDAPDMGPYVLPGNNYRAYDYALFWANIRRDAQERLTTFLAR